jgi:anti-sigma regulatory factor (Ser/Thr protein kinase)
MQQATLWSHEVLLPASARSAATARAFVARQLVAHRLLHLVEAVRLVVSELATNAVTHAETEFTVVLEGREHSVRLTVSDGSPIAPTLLRYEADDLRSTGRGLQIVDEMSQSWGVVEQDGIEKSVWATFQIRSTLGLDHYA